MILSPINGTISRIIIGALAALAVSAGFAHAQDRVWEVGWYLVFETDSGCGMGMDVEFHGRSDVRFTLSIDSTDRVSAGFASLDWTSIEQGELFDVALLFRGNGWQEGLGGEVSGMRSPGVWPGFAVAADENFLDFYARANDLVVLRGDTVVTHFNLQGSGAAIARLRSCNRDRQAAIAAQERRERQFDYIERDPFAKPPVEDSEE